MNTSNLRLGAPTSLTLCSLSIVNDFAKSHLLQEASLVWVKLELIYGCSNKPLGIVLMLSI